MDSLQEEERQLPEVSASIARQPPSRHGRSQMPFVKEVTITEMVSRPYYHRACKRMRKSLTNINSLPDELLFDILQRLSARHIYDNARFVCRKWYHMIHNHDFIHAHLHRTTYGILFHNNYLDSFMVIMKQGQIEISRYRNYTYVSGTSCNGLVSGTRICSSRHNYIINPVTRDVFGLPPIDGWTYRYSGIGYAAVSMEYKVVSSPEPCVIFTVGVDKSWRILPTQHLSSSAKIVFGSSSTPVATEGYLHWVQFRNPILTLNIETETFFETPYPVPELKYRRAAVLSSGRYLSLLVKCGEFSWKVWEMKPEIGEWRKLQLEIAVEAQKLKSKQFNGRLIPVAWLEYLEVLVFRYGREGLSLYYNLGTHEINSIMLPFSTRFCRSLVHKSSLVWLGGIC